MSIEQQRENLIKKIEHIQSFDFEEVALELFRFQAICNSVYKEYINHLNVDPLKVKSMDDIPFFPIQFFKNHLVKSGNWTPEITFTSSGTTGATTSRHPLKNKDWYRKNARKGFEAFYGSPSGYCTLALLPAYLERTGSSLVFMADDFIQQSKYSQSGFFLNNLEELVKVLQKNIEEKVPTLLLGVSFALWDLAEQYPLDLNGVIIMETGGMKGRRKEITRKSLHDILKKGFGVNSIHSEYGMTELLSQAYSKGNGLFNAAPTMKVLTREITDPLTLSKTGKNGVLNIIDLANLDTCSFIATEDLGRVYENGSFEILGRLDASDIRGCNLMVL